MYLFIVKNKNSMNIFIQPFNYTFLLKFGLGYDSIETGLLKYFCSRGILN